MSSQDLGALQSLVNTSALTSYHVDLEIRTYNCRRWQVTVIPCAHFQMVLEDKRLPTEQLCDEYFHLNNFVNLLGIFHPLTWTNE